MSHPDEGDREHEARTLEQLAEDAMLQTRLLQNNPRDMEKQDALAIYQAIYQ